MGSPPSAATTVPAYERIIGELKERNPGAPFHGTPKYSVTLRYALIVGELREGNPGARLPLPSLPKGAFLKGPF